MVVALHYVSAERLIPCTPEMKPESKKDVIGVVSHALFGCLCRGDVVRVEYGDGGSEIAGILSRDGEGYWVTVPAEDVRRWVPDHAISKCVSSSMVERETSGVNTAEPGRDSSPVKAVIGVRFPADAPNPPPRLSLPCPRCGYCGFIEDADMNLSGVCPDCRGAGRSIILPNVKGMAPGSAVTDSESITPAGR